MKNRQYNTHLSAGTITLFTIVILFMSGAETFAQYSETYLVKRMGNLLVFDVGKNHGILNDQNYEVSIRKITKIPLIGITIRKSFKSLGYVRITQLYPKFSVTKAVSLKPDHDYKSGALFFLKPAVFSEYPESETPVKLQQDPPKIDKIQEQYKPADRQIRGDSFTSGRKNPFGLGPRYSFGYSNFYNGISGSLENYLTENTNLYANGAILTKENPSGRGYGISIQKSINSFSAVAGEFSRISIDGKFTSEADETDVNNIMQLWEVTTAIKLNVFSVSGYFGKLGRLSDYFLQRDRKGGLIYYIGGGFDYASMNVTFDHMWNRLETDGSLKKGTTSEKTSLKGYSGFHGLAGASYLTKAGRFFVELWYIKWQKSGLGESIPLRFGFDVIF